MPAPPRPWGGHTGQTLAVRACPGAQRRLLPGHPVTRGSLRARGAQGEVRGKLGRRRASRPQEERTERRMPPCFRHPSLPFVLLVCF